MLDFLVRTGELSGAARDYTFFATRGGVAHHWGMQGTRTVSGKFIRLRRFRALLHDDAQHLRDDIPGTLDRHSVVLAHPKPLDLIGVMQRRVLHDHPADSDRLELSHRRERAGAANLDI